MSRILARLRDALQDPVLVRQGRRMTATPRAAALLHPLQKLLADAGGILRPAAFNPARADATVRVFATDAATESVVSPWLSAASHAAPGMSFEILPMRADVPAALAQGDADFAVDCYPDPPEGCRVEHLLFDRFVCLLRKGHPIGDAAMTRQRFEALRHIQITGTGGGGAALEGGLARLGIRRDMAMRMPSMVTAALFAAKTDWALTLTSARARRAMRNLPLAAYPLPFFRDELPLSVLWHARVDTSPLHRWLKRLLRKVKPANLAAVARG